MCGAAASTEATRCEHCGARLATVACPNCFGMMFVGEKFCSHCGAQAARTQTADAAPELCPRCRVQMEGVVIGNSNLRECPQCEGIWADAGSLRQICEDKEKQGAVLGMASHLPQQESVDLEQNIHYIPCPACQELMNRVNFANCSHVIVDVCVKHGTWFDRDELRRIVEFIRAGGMEEARRREIEDLKEQEAQLRAGHLDRIDGRAIGPSGTNYDHWNVGISAAAQFLTRLLR